ncbi:hypothetical protein HanIR_Chr01g0014461 [Helianthus annuus]|nr:hypothetical protein HanIR_Chr01g0014461 [Helianthus annuus]
MALHTPCEIRTYLLEVIPKLNFGSNPFFIFATSLLCPKPHPQSFTTQRAAD